MKVLLLTYSFNYNYGGLLQAYATVSYLQNQGHAVTVPTSHPGYLAGNTSLFRGLGLRRQNPFTSILRRLRQVKRYRRFDEFRSRLPLNRKLSGKTSIQQNAGTFDAILTGSDQTWNTKFMPVYEPYFYQGFIAGSVRKVSYAACFGTREQRPEILEQAAPDIAKFDSISVRNDVSRQIVHEQTGIDPYVVVDPTLLHDFEELRCSSPEDGAPPFVMVYALDPANFPLAEEIIGQLRARNAALQVHFVNGEKNFDKPAWATHLINHYGPVEFLESIQHASCVVTDSFHGVIFAQKFGRPCIAYTSGWRSERIRSIMADFNSSDLLLMENDSQRIDAVISKVIDDGARLQMSESLKQKIDMSKSYLSLALPSQ